MVQAFREGSLLAAGPAFNAVSQGVCGVQVNHVIFHHIYMVLIRFSSSNQYRPMIDWTDNEAKRYWGRYGRELFMMMAVPCNTSSFNIDINTICIQVYVVGNKPIVRQLLCNYNPAQSGRAIEKSLSWNVRHQAFRTQAASDSSNLLAL